ncbi:MAG: glycosyltransferase [Novosphingobium sp.]
MTPKPIVFVWESFGPSHFDRIEAIAREPGLAAIGIEFNRQSRAYQWERGEQGAARRVSLFDSDRQPGQLALTWRLLRAVLGNPARNLFLCHYNYPPVFIAALAARLFGRRVFAMLDSKYDDYPRFSPREWFKRVLLFPYNGALVASRRSADYARQLGFRRRPVAQGFDSLDVSRLRSASAGARDLPHVERDFLIVARLVAKKNLPFALRAFATHRARARHARKLQIIGYGDQEAELRRLAEELGIADSVLFEGMRDSPSVARAMAEALCLILPSIEEQFGLVVIEALAQGLPVLVSSNAGAVDELVDHGGNGWVIDPYRLETLTEAMALLDRDEAQWRAARAAASASCERGDVRHFVAGVQALVQAG